MSHGWLFRDGAGYFLLACPDTLSACLCPAPCRGPVWSASICPLPLDTCFDSVHVSALGDWREGEQWSQAIFPDYFLLGHCGVAACCYWRSWLLSGSLLHPATLFTARNHVLPCLLQAWAWKWLPAVGPWILHIHLISLNPVHTLLNNLLVKLSLIIQYEYSICFLAIWVIKVFSFFLLLAVTFWLVLSLIWNMAILLA